VDVREIALEFFTRDGPQRFGPTFAGLIAISGRDFWL
jgi:hypothetical protein